MNALLHVYRALEPRRPISERSDKDQWQALYDFARDDRETFELVVAESFHQGNPLFRQVCDALLTGDEAHAGRLLARMVQIDGVNALDRARGDR